MSLAPTMTPRPRFAATPRDSFPTYFYLQAAVACPLAIKAVEDALSGHVNVQEIALPSQQFYHPTIWFYLWTALRKGVW